MKKVTIEVEIPEGIDLEHCWNAVDDALWLPENVTNQEYLFVTRVIGQVLSANKHDNQHPNS